MSDYSVNRTRIELLLMELLWQTVRTEFSSTDSEDEALRRAGFTGEEINLRRKS